MLTRDEEGGKRFVFNEIKSTRPYVARGGIASFLHHSLSATPWRVRCPVLEAMLPSDIHYSIGAGGI